MITPGSFDKLSQILTAGDGIGRKKGEQVKMIDLIERRLPQSQESLAFDSSEKVTQQNSQ